MSRSAVIVAAGLALLLLAHGGALWNTYPGACGPFTSEPLIEQDYAQHFHHVMSARAFMNHSRRLSGYNPFFMAGYESNTIQDVSIKLPEMLAAVLSPFDPVLVFNIVVCLMAALTPLALAAGAWGMFRACGVECPGCMALAGAVFGTLAWWNGYGREMFFYGMVGFPPGCALAVAWLGLWLKRMTDERDHAGIGSLAGLAAVAILLPAVHIQSAGFAALLTFGGMFAGPWRRRPRLWLELAALGIFAFGCNAMMLLPMIRRSGGVVYGRIAEEFAFFASSDPLTFLKAYLPGGSYFSFRSNPLPPVFRLGLLVAAAVGSIRMFKRGAASSARIWCVFAVVAFIVTYFGSFIPPVRALQPMRFEVMLDLLLAPLAVMAFRRVPRGYRSVIDWVAPSLAATAMTTGIINIALTEHGGTMKARVGLTPGQLAIVDWIAHRTPFDGRVLFEESGDETGFTYDGSYLSAFIPHLTGRSLIGGPANYYNDPASRINFHDGVLLGRRIESFTTDELRAVLWTYNIAAIVAFTPEAVSRFAGLEDMIGLDRVLGPVSMFLLKGGRSWAFSGNARITAGLDGIAVRDATSAPDGRIDAGGPARLILKLHWADGLVAEPPCGLEPVIVGDDPIPFIGVTNPPPDFVIHMAR